MIRPRPRIPPSLLLCVLLVVVIANLWLDSRNVHECLTRFSWLYCVTTAP